MGDPVSTGMSATEMKLVRMESAQLESRSVVRHRINATMPEFVTQPPAPARVLLPQMGGSALTEMSVTERRLVRMEPVQLEAPLTAVMATVAQLIPVIGTEVVRIRRSVHAPTGMNVVRPVVLPAMTMIAPTTAGTGSWKMVKSVMMEILFREMGVAGPTPVLVKEK